MNPDPANDPNSTHESPQVPVATPAISRERLSKSGFLSWIIIIAATIVMILLTIFAKQRETTDTVANKSDLMQIQMQSRAVVAQRNLTSASGGSKKNETKTKQAIDDAKGDDSTTDELKADDTKSGEPKADESTADKAKDNSKKSKPKSKSKKTSLVPKELNDGTYEQRLCYTVLINEIDGAKAGIQSLKELDRQATENAFEKDERQTQLRTSLGTIFEQQAGGDFTTELPQEDRDLIVDSLDWVGELALHPAGTPNAEKRKSLMADANGSMWSIMGIMGGGAFTLFLGFIGLMFFTVMFASKKFLPYFSVRGSGLNIYIETFAIWMILFFGAQNLIAQLGLIQTNEQSLMMSPIIFFGSLSVLIYPVMRGISFSQVLSDIGLKSKTPIKEIVVAPLVYISWTPVILTGFFLVFIMILVTTAMQGPRPFGSGMAPGHPIQEFIAEGNATMIFFVFLTACVAAPIVEETMFRGILYRHLRELTGGKTRWISVVVSAVFNGLIFAAIHPQGLVAVPMLTSLAIGFSLAREWRDSLIAPMVMHGINNGLVTCFMLLIM